MEKLKRKRGDRRDGIWLRDLDALHTIMPYIYPNRADNEAFISERIDLEPINRYLEEKNRGNDGEPYKFFQLLIAALALVEIDQFLHCRDDLQVPLHLLRVGDRAGPLHIAVQRLGNIADLIRERI